MNILLLGEINNENKDIKYHLRYLYKNEYHYSLN